MLQFTLHESYIHSSNNYNKFVPFHMTADSMAWQAPCTGWLPPMQTLILLARCKHACRLSRLSLAVVPERSCWVGLPPALVNQLYASPNLATPMALALHIIDPATGAPIRGRPPVYVAWGGGVARSNNAVEVPAGLAACLGLAPPHGHMGAQGRGNMGRMGAPGGMGPGLTVSVQPLLGVPAAEAVEVEPRDASDWEVLESNAQALEEQILNQVGGLLVGRFEFDLVWKEI